MSLRILAVVAFASLALSACGGGAPTKKDVQEAVERLAVEQPIYFGEDKPIIHDASCTKVGKESYDCVTSMGFSSEPNAAMTVTVKLTKLNKQWTAQIPNILQ